MQTIKQAIVTKYLPATDFKPSRIKASCERGSITLTFGHQESIDLEHIAAAESLCNRFTVEDEKRYGSNKNPWAGKRACGQIPSGEFVHVFI